MSKPPIFVFGCPRSGTTLLRVMLNAHHDIAIPPENRFVIPLHLQGHSFRSRSPGANARRMARHITRPGRGAIRLGVTREELIADFAECPPTSASDALERVFSRFADRRGASRWGDKRPAYYAYTAALNQMFPAAQFIHLVRDGRACVASLKRPPFDYTPDRATATWLNALHAGRRAARVIGGARVLQVRYEDLISNPESTLRRVCDFLGEPFEASMLHPERVVAAHVPTGFQQHEQVAAGIYRHSLQAWERELSGGEVHCIQRLGGTHFRHFGYAPVEPGRPAPLLLAKSAVRHAVFRAGLPITEQLDGRAAEDSLVARVARRAQRSLRPQRLLLW